MNEKDWKSLRFALTQNKCILMLGPNLATITQNNQPIQLTTLLANELAAELISEGVKLEQSSDNLRYVATEYFNQNGENILAMSISDFYGRYAQEVADIYNQIADLPFYLAINTTPDTMLATACKRKGKYFEQSYYDYATKIEVKFDYSNTQRPLIYNLFGTYENPYSLVITENDILQFITAIMRKESSIPDSIAKEFTSDKMYIFLGFDFEQWYLRVLLHALQLNSEGKQTSFAPKNLFLLEDESRIFFKNLFKLNFLEEDTNTFILDFTKLINTLPTVSPPLAATGKKVTILYCEADEKLSNELDKHLATLKNNKLIQTWLPSRILPGQQSDQIIEENIKNADIILLIISANFLASDELYKNQLQQALQKHSQGTAIVIPILMRPCLFEDTPFAKLPTLLPRMDGAVLEWESRDEAFTHIAQEIEKMLH